MRITIAILWGALVLSAGAAYGSDVWGGPPDGTWDRFADGTTFTHWDFLFQDWTEPDEWFNPYGPPDADIPIGFEWGLFEAPPSIDPDGDGFVEGWHCLNPAGGTITLTIPNSADPEGTKWIYLQVTSSKKPTGDSAAGPPGTASGTWNPGRPDIMHGGPSPFGGSWYTYSYGLYVQPNPQSETITIEVIECTVIDQIVVDTICTQDPIANDATTWSGVKALYR